MTEGEEPPETEEVSMANRDATDGSEAAAAVADRKTGDSDAVEAASGEPPTDSSATDGPSEPDADPGALVVVCGLPGVGKTTVAERVADHVDGRILRTDVIRKDLFEDPQYTDSETEAVYAELRRRARDCVAEGSAAVLDATFADARFRDDVREMAERIADGFELVEVECEEAVVERRIERRDGISDADFEIHLHFKELYDRIEADHVVVDNSGDEAETYAQVDRVFTEHAE